jgi:small subunit ribosomal protein S2
VRVLFPDGPGIPEYYYSRLTGGENKLAIVTMKELLEAGVHFGHQTRRWDPRMKPYIFTERNGIHIIDLQRTITHLKSAYNVVKELAKSNRTILFVGTKRQAQSAIVEEANRCGMPFVANRWLGGMLTNFETIQKSIQRLKKLERMEVDGSFDFMTKKEVIHLTREKEKLLKNIGGIKDLENIPDMIFIIDPKKEAIAVAEAMRLKVPIVAIIDTNCNPDGIDYPIPGNDDAIRAINLFAAIVSSAVIEGQNEAGKIEITEETQIVSLEEEEQARASREKAEKVEDYLSDEEPGAAGVRAQESEAEAAGPESGVSDAVLETAESAAEEKAEEPETAQSVVEEKAEEPETAEPVVEEKVEKPETAQSAAEEKVEKPETAQSAAEEKAEEPETAQSVAEEKAEEPEEAASDEVQAEEKDTTKASEPSETAPAEDNAPAGEEEDGASDDGAEVGEAVKADDKPEEEEAESTEDKKDE